ncbi:unnamed protein product [Ostreobium quekettii]|uniref:Uncharacterized protein n=1 Tax=Ostreobium quekettii TaxID=121088 RepID=A0A8S1JFX7_9CHLO|nr:unnamed protein product [Ostreobium quekettii]|eukprot:evm.model.scf_231.10 EVM.evm.TU.scf_231.10   scf_231:111076-116161(-)
MPGPREEDAGPLKSLARTAEFWARASGIYLSYKVAQARARARGILGAQQEAIQRDLWEPHNQWAGQQLYNLCVDLRGFYLKAGQFLGARGDFIPEPVCRQLSKLHDQVPPMPAQEAEAVLKKELCVEDIGEVFEWVDFEKPLGSASIAQVHKAKLRHAKRNSVKQHRGVERSQSYIVKNGEQAWDICNHHGITFDHLMKSNRGIDVRRLAGGQVINLPIPETLRGGDGTALAGGLSAPEAAARAMLGDDPPKDGTVAVKLQYPGALKIMKQDLKNIRKWAAFLSKTEIKFDMVSAVEELQRQIQLEFNFEREARVMDIIAQNLRSISKRVIIPRSVPGLVTPRLLVMHYVNGIPLRSLQSRTAGLSLRKQRIAKRRILSRVSEAYGRMILIDGLFQADGHPGNILVLEGGKVALLDYGQSKQLGEEERRLFANLVLALNRCNVQDIDGALKDLGVVTERDDKDLRARMAHGMFNTIGRVDPFDKSSPIKSSGITHFPPDYYLILRVVQLLRGMKQGMDIGEFSCASQWSPFAREALKQL